MVTWSGDTNLDEICEDINKYISRYKMRNYYVYGLQQADRPHVRICPGTDSKFIELFKNSGYTIQIVDGSDGRYCSGCDEHHTPGNCCCHGECELCDSNTVSIGLRKDIRQCIPVARKLIKTLIFATEGKLIVKNKAVLRLGRRVSK